MQIDCKGRYGKAFSLRVQTNPDNVDKQALWLAIQWAPKKAKSFTMSCLTHTDYNGRPIPISQEPTGYANFAVHYFTTIKEGKNKLTNKK